MGDGNTHDYVQRRRVDLFPLWPALENQSFGGGACAEGLVLLGIVFKSFMMSRCPKEEAAGC